MPPVYDGEKELQKVRTREIELRRIRGEIACAECRRLKLKCDKKNPCSNCTRRGCKDVCPTRTSILTVERIFGSNAALSSPPPRTSDGFRDVQGMKERIKALEDALAKQCGPSSHPLLAPDLLAHGTNFDYRQSDEVDSDDTLADAIGTLSISEGKTTRYFGATASVYLVEHVDSASQKHCADLSLPMEIVQASRMWPFVPAYLSDAEHTAQLVLQLPSYERAVELSNACFSNMMHFTVPMDRSQVSDEIMPLFYHSQKPISFLLVKGEHLHDLALLFIMLACGCLALSRRPAESPEGEKFLHLARASLGMRSYIDHGSLEACQTLFMMGQYDMFSGRKTSMESTWKSTSVALAIALSIGLQRDPSHWKLDPRRARYWRRAFWEMNTADKRMSLESGRPAIFEPSAIDCEFPQDHYSSIKEDGTVVESSCQWRYRFVRDVLSVLAKKLTGRRLPKYSDIMEMDKLVRDFDLHPLFDQGADFFTYGITASDDEYPILHPIVSWWWKHAGLFYVHRNYFARALLEYPNDPMRSPFGPSFLSAYQAATAIITKVYGAHVRLQIVSILKRQWPIWAVILSCSMIVGTVACRLVTINFASSALETLEKAIRIFESVSNHHVLPPNGLSMLYRLRDKANAAFGMHNSRITSPTLDGVNGSNSGRDVSCCSDALISQPPNEFSEIAEELDMLRGAPRYVERRTMPTEQAILEPTSALPSSICSTQSRDSAGLSLPALPPQTSDERESAFAYILRMHSMGSSLTPSTLVEGDSGGTRKSCSQLPPGGEESMSEGNFQAEHSDMQSTQPELSAGAGPSSDLESQHPRSESSSGPFSEMQDPFTAPVGSGENPPCWYGHFAGLNESSRASMSGSLGEDNPQKAPADLFGAAFDQFSADLSDRMDADLDAVYETSTYGPGIEAWNELLRQFDGDSNPI